MQFIITLMESFYVDLWDISYILTYECWPERIQAFLNILRKFSAGLVHGN